MMSRFDIKEMLGRKKNSEQNGQKGAGGTVKNY